MSVATPGAIRDAIIARVASLVPPMHASVRYVGHREEIDFRRWADANPGAALRRYTVETIGDTTDPVVSSTLLERVTESMEIVVAYPNDARHRNRLGLHDAISSDLRYLTYHAGTNGFSIQPLAIQAGGNDACVISGTHRRETDSPVVTFGVIPLTISYQRSVP